MGEIETISIKYIPELLHKVLFFLPFLTIILLYFFPKNEKTTEEKKTWICSILAVLLVLIHPTTHSMIEMMLPMFITADSKLKATGIYLIYFYDLFVSVLIYVIGYITFRALTNRKNN